MTAIRNPEILRDFIHDTPFARVRVLVTDHAFYCHDLLRNGHFAVDVDGWDYLNHLTGQALSDPEIDDEMGWYAIEQYMLLADEDDDTWARYIPPQTFKTVLAANDKE